MSRYATEDDALKLIKMCGFTKQVPKPYAHLARVMGMEEDEFAEFFEEELAPIYKAALGWRFREGVDYVQLISPAPKGGPQLLEEQQRVKEFFRERRRKALKYA